MPRIDSRIVGIAITAIALHGWLGAADAQAADAAACDQYAKSAVAQAQKNLQNKCGYTGPVWVTDYNAHYNWCLLVPNQMANDGRTGRDADLAKCSSGPKMIEMQPLPFEPPGMAPGDKMQTTQQACTSYANDSVAQHKENLAKGCGFPPPRWSADHQGHYQWCLSAPPGLAKAESQARQAELATCYGKNTCDQYAKTAVAQNSENLQKSCSFSGPAWDSNYNNHKQWCMHGDNAKRAAAESQSRQTQLARCGAAKPLVGGFTIHSVTPQFDANGVTQGVDVVIDADSQAPWSVGDFGHAKYGSLWMELRITNKVWLNGLVQDEVHDYRFAIRGIASGETAFMAPPMGTTYPAGKRRITLKVMPFPHVKLNGIQQVFGLSGGPFQPGKLGCWQFYPEVEAQVFIVTGSTAATQTSKAEFQNAPLQNVGVPKPSGGVIYYACR